jgi:hypothetical protein
MAEDTMNSRYYKERSESVDNFEFHIVSTDNNNSGVLG